jgi:hypothetical protein
MKTRRVVATVEIDTAWSLANVKAQLKMADFPGDCLVRQVQVNIIKPTAKKPKK